MVKKWFYKLKGDRVIWVITLLLLSFSLVTVYSFVPILVKVEGGTAFKYMFKHLIYILIGFSAMYWVHKKDPIYFSKLARFTFIASIALLVFTFFFGKEVNGAGRWVQIPFVGLTFQSSDFAKLALVMYLARLLVKKEKVLDSWKEGFLPILTPIILVCALIVKDNFSTAAIVFMMSLVILFLGRVPLSKIATLIFGGILLGAVVVVAHKSFPDLNLLPRYDTWENRILNRYEDNGDAVDNAQAINAMIGIMSGGLFGLGIGDGKVKEFIPEAYADFYFASFVEEFGIVGGTILMLLYLILFYRMIRIALRSDRLFETYLVLGIGLLLLSQASVNMLVCTGVFPVTGQNMPLLAMGGSALIMSCIAIGMVQSIAAKQQSDTDEPKGENELS